MATSKPTIDTASKRAPIRPRTSPPTIPTVPAMRKSETTNTRRHPNAPTPLSPSATKRSAASLSKPITSGTSHVKSPKPKKNPSPVVTPTGNKVHSLKSNKEVIPPTKSPSPKPKAQTSITRSSSSIRTSTKTGNISAPFKGRNPVAGTKTANKVGGTTKPTNKKNPVVGPKSGTMGSLSRVNSAPNLAEEVIDLHGGKETEVPAEIEKDVNNLEEKDEEIESILIPLLVEEEKNEDEPIEITGENNVQIETNTETEEKKDEKEPTEEVTSETVTTEPVTIATIPKSSLPVQAVPVAAAQVPDLPAAADPVPDLPVVAEQVPAVTVPAVPVPAVTVVAHGKKEVATSNAAIEETRSKLIAERRNKVLALVGAFESVMKEKEKEGENQAIIHNGQNISKAGQNGESKGKDDEVEDGEKPA